MIKLALCMIVKPTDREAELLDRCLKSVHKHVDGIFITITSEKSGDQTISVEKVCKKYGANISYFKWINNFAAARNYNFSQVSEDYTHIFWCDSDDIIRGAKHLRKVTGQAQELAMDAVILNYEYSYDEFGNCTTKHMKTRIVRNDGCVEWAGAVHEDFHSIRDISGAFNKEIVIEHRTDNERISAGTDRNLEIALNELEEKPKDPRSYWLAANAYIMAEDKDKAKSNYLLFLEKSHSNEEKYMAWMRLADLYEGKQAVDCAIQAMVLRPDYPDTWFKLGEIHFKQHKYKHAREYMINGFSKKFNEQTMIVHNPMDQNYNPQLQMAKILIELDTPEYDKEATKLLKQCYKIRPVKALEVLIYGLEHNANRNISA